MLSSVMEKKRSKCHNKEFNISFIVCYDSLKTMNIEKKPLCFKKRCLCCSLKMYLAKRNGNVFKGKLE